MHTSETWRRRVAVAAAALGVLAVVALPPVVAGVVEAVAPPPDARFSFTPLADRAASLPRAERLADAVVVDVPYPDKVAALAGQRVDLADLVGTPRYTLREGLVPLEPEHLPGGGPSWVADLGPEDRVFAALGPVVLACVRTARGCTESVLTLHPSGYYRFPAALPPAGRLDGEGPLPTLSIPLVEGRLALGVLAGAVAEVELHGVGPSAGSEGLPAATAPHGDGGGADGTVWWAVVDGELEALTGYDREGRPLGTRALEPSG